MRSPSAAEADFAAVDAYLEEQRQALDIPGMAVAIVQGDQVAHLGSYGEADSDGRPVTPQTPFQIGSTTKSFTALAVMQLVEAGLVELDAPVQTYLPWFRVADEAASAQITIRHLLNQTSGLSTATGRDEFAASDLSDQAIENSVRALADVELTAAPGATYQYCNTNFTIAGLVVQVVSGQSYESYMQAHIFDPLEMRHSFTAQEPAEQDGLATGYVTFLGIPVRREHTLQPRRPAQRLHLQQRRRPGPLPDRPAQRRALWGCQPAVGRRHVRHAHRHRPRPRRPANPTPWPGTWAPSTAPR